MRAYGWSFGFAAILAAGGGWTWAPESVAEQRVEVPAARDIIVVVDLSMRQLDIRINGALYGTYDVAVGEPEHPTPTGTFTLSKVIWNPAWVPPDRSGRETGSGRIRAIRTIRWAA